MAVFLHVNFRRLLVIYENTRANDRPVLSAVGIVVQRKSTVEYLNHAVQSVWRVGLLPVYGSTWQMSKRGATENAAVVYEPNRSVSGRHDGGKKLGLDFYRILW